MPKTTFEFEISTTKPRALIIGPDYLSKPIASLFRQKGLSVQTSFTNNQVEPIDYIVDIEGSRNLINLSAETGAKYLRLAVGKDAPTYQTNIKWRVLITDFLVGPEIPETSLMGKVIKAAIRNQPIILPAPEKKLFPLHLNDLAEACWQALIVPNTSNKEFLVLGEEVKSKRLGTYLENLGQTTKGIQNFSDLEVKNYDLGEIETSCQALNWQPNLSWQEAIKKSFQSMWSDNLQPAPEPIVPKKVKEIKPAEKLAEIEKDFQQKIEEEVIVIEENADEEEVDEKEAVEEIEFKPPTDNEEDKDGLRWWQPLGLVLFLSICFLFSVWIKPAFRLGLGAWQMREAYTHLMSQNWDLSLEKSQKAKENFLQAETFLKNSKLTFLFFGYEKLFSLGAELGRKSALTAETAIPFLKNSLLLSESVLKNKPFEQEEAINQLITDQNTLNFQLKEIQSLLKGSWPGMPGRWQNTPEQAVKKIDQVQEELSKLDQVLPHLPWIIGLDNQRRTFMVLLQNNMELRPTGGFIGSFALLTFENGQLLDFQVQDVYTADGQLKGHIEPPKQIKEILGEAKWYLRDSNWNPDFPKTTENVKWFLEKSLNRQVDGVIGFNLEATKKLLAAFGEIYLADFNERISAENIFERAEFWSENDSFPGSNQKAAFLGIMGQQLFENIKAARPEEYAKIGQGLLNALEEKEILIYTDNNQFNLTLQQLNWDGALRSPQCLLENCFTDYLYLNEANLGVNKANYFLRRSIEKGITINNTGKIDHQLKINYENTAASKNWPGGDYLAWLRIYLPIETKINSISIYDPQNPGQKKMIQPEDRDDQLEFGKRVIGFKIEVPIQQRQTLEVNYHQQAQISKDSFGYFLYWQKQSGYRHTPLSLLINYPDNWHPLQVTPSANVVSGKLLFNQQLNKDLNFGIQLSN